MSELKIYGDDNPNSVLGHWTGFPEIQAELQSAGVRFEQWQTEHDVSASDSQDQIIAAYRADIDRLVADQGYQVVDVISLAPDHPDKTVMRQKFLAEHTHGEDEVRFFVAGHGLFSLHIGNRVYEILCERGDLLGVPANTAHWFDMGPNPEFVAIRLFNNPEGWVARYTGSTIADRFNRLEDQL